MLSNLIVLVHSYQIRIAHLLIQISRSLKLVRVLELARKVAPIVHCDSDGASHWLLLTWLEKRSR